MTKKLTNISHSVHERLLNLAKQTGRSYNDVEHYYAMERFLYRLGCSPHSERFVLKGALMLSVWTGASSRSTRDIDLLGHTTNSVGQVVQIVRDCLSVQVADDGVWFDPNSVAGQEIVLAADYPGVRVRFAGTLGTSRLALQVDVGFGDVVVPAPATVDYPALLDYARPHLLGYSAESIVAEKLHAIVTRDMANTRLKDFHDISTLAGLLPFEGAVLARAIGTVFARRHTPIPVQAPMGLTPTFSKSSAKLAQWTTFTRTARVPKPVLSLAEVVAAVSGFVLQPMTAVAVDEPFILRWTPPGPWR